MQRCRRSLCDLTDGSTDASVYVSAWGGQHFSMQSVMKLIAGMAVMDAVDHCQPHLQDAIVAWREDLSLIRAAHRRAGHVCYDCSLSLSRAIPGRSVSGRHLASFTVHGGRRYNPLGTPT